MRTLVTGECNSSMHIIMASRIFITITWRSHSYIIHSSLLIIHYNDVLFCCPWFFINGSKNNPAFTQIVWR